MGVKEQAEAGGKPSDKTGCSQNGLYLYEKLQIAAMDTLETSEVHSLFDAFGALFDAFDV